MRKIILLKKKKRYCSRQRSNQTTEQKLFTFAFLKVKVEVNPTTAKKLVNPSTKLTIENAQMR